MPQNFTTNKSRTMSSISEYLKLIPIGFKNRDKVIEGTINAVRMHFGILPKGEQDEIVRRRLICHTCKYQSENAKEEGYTTNRIDAHCILCNCPISSKTASLQSMCGADVWNQNHPKEQLPIKWDVYKTK